MSTTSFVARRDTVLGWQYVQRQGTDRDGNVLVLGPDGKRAKVAASEVVAVVAPERAANVANLLDLDFNEANVFLTLHERYARGLIYTFLGTSLVSLNPNYPQELYSSEVQAMYRGLPNWQTQRVPPHLYSVAQFAYSELLHSAGEQPQTIVLSGRVGSGKTEASKYLQQFLMSLDPRHVPGAGPNEPEAEDGAGAAPLRPSQKFELCSIVLEALGNAATKENYNSSRFGLLTQVYFGALGEVVGGNLVPYLFERTRVTSFNEGERNFHLFYQFIKGATHEEKKTFVLLAPSKYRYLRMGNIIDLAEVDDVGQLARFRHALRGLGLQGFQTSIFRILSAILHLGNVSFVFDEQSAAVCIKSPKVLNIVAALLACDENLLAQSMCEAVPPPTLDDEEPAPATRPAEDMRDLIAQTLYARLFDWVLAQLNNQLRTEPTTRCISLLDQLGFEDCEHNGLPQLSVNYASERLFSDLIETRNAEEQELYVEEGVNWEKLKLSDGLSTMCLEVFDAPDVGVWDVLTEETQNANAVDVDVINRLGQTFSGGQVLQLCEGRYDLLLRHLGGDVLYKVKGFLVDNTEAISDVLWSCFESSTSAFVRSVFDSQARAESASLLSVRAPADINYVLSLVMPTRLHFIHCIAPNTQGQADFVDGNAMLLQVLASGLLGTGTLRGSGYLCNWSHDEIMQRYGVLAVPRPRARKKATASDCQRLLRHLLADLKNDSLVFVGASRVFLTHAAFRVLEAKRSARLKKAAGDILSIALRMRFLKRVTELVAQKAPRRSAGAPSVVPKSPRRGLPVLPPAAAAAGAASRSSGGPAAAATTAQSGAEAAVDLTRAAIALVRLVYKEPLPRGEVVQKLKELKQVEEEFRQLERASMAQDEAYGSSVESVVASVAAFCDNVRGVCRSNDDKPLLLKECKARHNDLVMAIRTWKSEYTRLTSGSSPARSPRVSHVSAQAPPKSVSLAVLPKASSSSLPSLVGSVPSTSSSPGPSSSPAPRRVPPSLPSRSATVELGVSRAERGATEVSMGSPRGAMTQSARTATGTMTSPRMSGSPMASPRSQAKVVFHDSPKQKRKAQTREIMGKIVSSGGSMKETLDKLDAELGLKDLKKDSCILQLDLADGTRLRTKVSTKWTGLEAKNYIMGKAGLYLSNGSAPNPADYMLKVHGLPSSVSNESVPLSRVAYIQACAYVFVIPVLELVMSSQWDARQDVDLTAQISSELSLHTTISKLIGPSFRSFLEVEDDEFTLLRSAMTHARLKHAKEMAASARSEGRTFMLHEYVDVEPPPPQVPDKIMVSLRLPTGQGMVAMDPSSTVDQILEQGCAKIRRADPKRKDTPDMYIVKETGRQSFLLGSELMRYDYVRNQICADKPLQLSLVEKASVLEAYSDEEFTRTSFMDRILASWLEDQPVMHDETNSEFISRPTLSELSRPWKLKLHGVQGVPAKYFANAVVDVEQISQFYCFVRLAVIQGDGQQQHVQFTKPCLASANLRWDQWLFVCPINQLSRGARLSISFHGLFTFDAPSTIDEDTCAQSERIGWVNIPMFDQYGALLGGSNTTGFQMWIGDEQAFDVTCQENILSETWLYVSFEDAKKAVVYPPPSRNGFRLNATAAPPRGVLAQQEQSRQEAKVKALVYRDLLTPLTNEEKKLLWEQRATLTDIPEALPKVLRAVNWNDYLHAQDMYTLMRDWCELKATQVLQLLSGFVLDPFIRDFAVERLAKLSDGDLLMFMPQLTQALKYEAYHFNSLAEFLVQRALGNRHRLGHCFFWSLKAEMHLPKVAGRYGCLLESYLRGAGTHRRELEMQGQLVDQLVGVAKGLKDIKDHEQRLTFLRSQLSNLQMPPRYQLPLDPRYEVSGLVVEKCKFMDSKKVPLWLVFKNAEEGAPNVTVIFKEGDDLRQDILTIQMLKLMNNLWKQEGLDLGMNPYGCISCGDEIGMIEVVGNSMTTAGIAREFGGAKAVLQKDVMLKWLRENNEKPEVFIRAQQNFMRSCAAYCVATYVLGIGDRHNDNIMITRTGYFFHIDFGHFLGNFKSKMGIKRETAPFVLTQQYVECMGGKKSALYREFVVLCGRIFNILRRNSDLFVTLFHMMLLTGIPELQHEKDIKYLVSALHLNLTEAEATKKFEKLIEEAQNSKMTLINHVIHNAAKR